MRIKSVVIRLVSFREKIGHRLMRPTVVLETSIHCSYCYFAFAEGHGFYSLSAGGLLVIILIRTLIVGE